MLLFVLDSLPSKLVTLLLWTGQARISTRSGLSLFAATNYLSLAISKAWHFGLQRFISRILGNLNSTIVEGNLPSLRDRSFFCLVMVPSYQHAQRPTRHTRGSLKIGNAQPNKSEVCRNPECVFRSE